MSEPSEVTHTRAWTVIDAIRAKLYMLPLTYAATEIMERHIAGALQPQEDLAAENNEAKRRIGSLSHQLTDELVDRQRSGGLLRNLQAEVEQLKARLAVLDNESFRIEHERSRAALLVAVGLLRCWHNALWSGSSLPWKEYYKRSELLAPVRAVLGDEPPKERA